MVNFELFSENWFTILKNETSKCDNLNLSPCMQSINLNIKVYLPNIKNDDDANNNITDNIKISDNEDDDLKEFRFNFSHGCITQAFDTEAKTTLLISLPTLYKLYEVKKITYLLQAFIDGEIQVYGDMSQLMLLQKTQFSEEQVQLFNAVFNQTKLPYA